MILVKISETLVELNFKTNMAFKIIYNYGDLIKGHTFLENLLPFLESKFYSRIYSKRKLELERNFFS